MTETQTLLAEYVESGSDGAFRELAARYVNLVYSTALRLLGGDTHWAEDVTQTVFVRLSHNARRLARESSLGGWLHRETCFAAGKSLRSERRRRTRELQAALMNSRDDHAQPNLEQVAPLLDDAINRLGNADRTAILLRFFEQRDFRSVGQALGSNEDAARKRVNRALDKLQVMLRRRGLALSASALGAVLADKAVIAAPAGLASSVAGSVLASSTAASGISATAINIIRIITMTKLKAGLLGALLVAGIATSVVVYCQARPRLRAQEELLRQQGEQLAQLETANRRLSSLAARANASPLGDPSRDLAALRAQAESLRAKTNDLARLRAENRRLRQASGDEPKTPVEAREELIATASCAKDWLVAFRIHALDNQGQCPTNFEQVASIHAQDSGKLGANTSPDRFEIVFQGSLDSLTNPGDIIVLRERQPQRAGDGNSVWVYGMADGSVQQMRFPQPQYDSPEAWEKGRILSPSAQ
ncbi:MAG: RNA polymerase sigma factor [Limisphaerales bacterium]